ncbi:universal stress protein [Saprospiraceae bacterium]|nr:universal stress protein [Saprospiraceae bacterium]
MKNLLIATDFSDTSKNAIHYANHVSEKINGDMTLLHVYRPRLSEGITDEVSEKAAEESAKQQLSEIKNKILGQGVDLNSGREVKTNFRYGLAADEILSMSSDADDSIIVLGVDESNETLISIFGSVSVSVLDQAKKPILALPPDVQFKEIKKIGYCTEDLNVDKTTICELGDIVDAFGSEIYLIHVIEKNEDFDESAVLKTWQESYPGHTIKLNIIEHDDKLDAINNFCESNKIDLLSMTRTTHGFFTNLFHKSFTKQMLINTHIPLFIMSEKEIECSE